MGAIPSNKPIIILLALFLLVLAGGAVFLMLQAFEPLEERQAPTILEIAPSLSAPVSRSIELSIAFDQRMDHISVEKSITISPDFAHSYEWSYEGQGERLIIHPQTLLDWDRTYRLVVNTTARNIANRPLTQAKELTFTTNSEIGILEVLPRDGTEGVTLNQPITIRFDRPLIDNSSLQAQDDLPQPVVLAPPILGIGQWLASDLYGFYPSEPLDGGTEYQVSINPLVAPGMELQEVYNWSFVTEGGRVSASYPFDGASSVEPTASIRLNFNQNLLHERIEENFNVSPQGKSSSVAGEFIWEDDQTLVFVPQKPLGVATSYNMSIETQGKGGLASPYHATFTTVDYLAVQSVEPAPDSVEISLVPTDTVIAVQFNHPVVSLVGLSEKEELPNPIDISPPLAGVGEWLTTSFFVYRPSASLLPSTEYLITVDPLGELHDTLGSFINKPFSWSFKTEFPRVLRVEPSNDYRFVSPLGPIGLRFNQPMDKNSTESAFVLRRIYASLTGEPLEGGFKWEEDDRLLLFYPKTPLARDAEYQLFLEAGAGGREGGITNKSFETTITAAPKLRVLKTAPEDGAVDVSPFDTIQLTFNTPINPNGALNHLTIVPTATDVYTYYDADSLTLNFSVAGTLEPSTTYTVTLANTLRDPSGQKLDKSLRFSFRTAPLPPELELIRPGSIIGTYNPYTSTLQLVRHLNVSQLEWSLYRMTRSELLPFLSSDAYEEWESYTAAALIDSWQVPLVSQQPLSDTLRQAQGAQTNISALYKTKLPPEGNQGLESGIYLLHVTAPERDPWSNKPLESKQIMVFTPVNLTIKRAPDAVLVWATDLKRGQPVPALAIELLTDLGDVIASGFTDNNGLFRYQIQPDDPVTDPYDPLIAISSSNEQVNGLVSTDWFSGIGPYEWDIADSLTPQALYGTIYTDRPIYRPGQTVYFRGALRQRATPQSEACFAYVPSGHCKAALSRKGADGLMIPALDDIKLNIKFQGEALSEQEVTLSPYGTFFGEFTLAEEADTGYYEVALEQEEIGQCYTDYCYWESVGGSFQVAEYQRPEFEVTVEMNQAAVVQGEELDAKVGANYYFGGVLSEAPFTWRLTSTDYNFDIPGLSGYWSWQDWDQFDSRFDRSSAASVIDEGQSQLSKDGRSRVSLETSLLPTTITPNGHAISQLYTFEADVRDLNDSIISNRSQTIIHAADYYVGLNLEQYLGNVAAPFSINIATADTTGELIGGQELSASFYQRQWYSVREEADNGTFFWTTTFSDTLAATRPAVTDESGHTTVSFTPEKGGSYTVLVLGKDKQGHEVRSRHFFWVTDDSYIAWGRDNDARLELVADKEQYQVGDVARILIPTPFEGMTALISQEQLTIQHTTVKRLAGTAEVLEVPITEQMIPNIVVSVVAMTGMSATTPLPEFRVGNINLNVVPTEKELTIKLLPLDGFGEPLQPGDEARFKIQVKDAAGKPVQAELSLAVVDKAILSLSDVQQPSLLDAFYSPRPLAVRTAISLIANVDRLSQHLAPDAKGGGGSAKSLFGPEYLRSQFVDTAYWKADLVTNGQGEAEISFILPDNLTTWTLTAQAISEDEAGNGPFVGSQQEELRTTLPLLVRPTLPRFFVAGDRAELRVAVHNNTSNSIDAQVTFEAEGFVSPSQGWGAFGGAVKVTIPANGHQILTFPVEVLDNEQLFELEAQEATITVSAEGAGFTDQVEQLVPIYYLTAPEVVATGGILREIEDSVVENIRLPEERKALQAKLNLELAPSLAGMTQSSLDWLKNYDYVNTESVASILLVNSATIQARGRVKTRRVLPELEESLRGEIGDGVQKLLTWQNNDGGWGWWVGDSSQEWLTAYALLALDEAKQAGFEVPEERLARSIRLLDRWLSRTADLSDDATLDKRAFLLYVLSEYASRSSNQEKTSAANDISRAIALFEQHSLLNHDGKAFLLMALDNANDGVNSEINRYIDTLTAELTANAHLSATGAHWEEKNLDPWAFDSNLRTTAIVLRALSRIEPEQLLLPQSVRWLMNARQGDYWQTTQATAWAILGLTDYMLATDELEADFSYEVALNDDIVLKEQATQDNLADAVTLNLEMTQLLLAADNNRLIIHRQPPTNGQSGKGQLYYSAWLHYTLPADTMTSRFEGISVARQYEAVNKTTLQSTGVQVEGCNVGEVMQVRLTINAPNDLHFFALEDPIPAGFELIDPALLTSSRVASLPKLEGSEEEQSPFWYDSWSQTVIRDHKIALFSDLLPRGTYDYTYLIRATIPGDYNVLPTYAYEEYHPEVFGRGSGVRFRVEP